MDEDGEAWKTRERALSGELEPSSTTFYTYTLTSLLPIAIQHPSTRQGRTPSSSAHRRTQTPHLDAACRPAYPIGSPRPRSPPPTERRAPPIPGTPCSRRGAAPDRALRRPHPPLEARASCVRDGVGGLLIEWKEKRGRRPTCSARTCPGVLGVRWACQGLEKAGGVREGRSCTGKTGARRCFELPSYIAVGHNLSLP